MVKVVQSVEELVLGLFGRVTEVLARATAALLEADPLLGQAVIDADQEMDEQTEAVRHLVWAKIDSERPTGAELRHLVSILLVLPELERSADLAEHIARRALDQRRRRDDPGEPGHRAAHVGGGDRDVAIGHCCVRRSWPSMTWSCTKPTRSSTSSTTGSRPKSPPVP